MFSGLCYEAVAEWVSEQVNRDKDSWILSRENDWSFERHVGILLSLMFAQRIESTKGIKKQSQFSTWVLILTPQNTRFNWGLGSLGIATFCWSKFAFTL